MADQTMEGADSDAIAMADAISSLLKSGGTLGEVFSETASTEIESMYAVGYGLYEQGRYDDAFKVFSLVVIQNHREPRYLFGLGSTCQMLGRYVDALQHYMAAAIACMDDPRPIFHAAECLIAMSRIEEAMESLRLVLEMCPDTQAPLHTRAQVLLHGLHPLKEDNDECL